MGRLILYSALFIHAAVGAEPWFFVQMSDPQFGMYAENRDFQQETANLEFAVATVNRWRPVFVVVTGDLVNLAGDKTQIAEYFRITGKIDPSIPVHPVAGNHDVGNNPTHESLAAYREKFGPDYYAFRTGELAAFVLDSSVIQHPEAVTDEYEKQEKWLRTELAKAKTDGVRHLVVFQHIPFFLKTADEPDQYFNIPLERRRPYLALLHEFGVLHVFAGHYHRNSLGNDRNLLMITTGPVGKPVEDGESGMRVAVVSDRGIQTRFESLCRLPSHVEIKVDLKKD